VEEWYVLADGDLIACLIVYDFLLYFFEKPIGELVLDSSDQL
jgi:hypothetical protein